jgi:sugar (pentulose or hexulose) kinase
LHTAVFDIGKTNKKFVLFDSSLGAVSVVTRQFEPTKDDDGEPCEDLEALTTWMRETFDDAMREHRQNSGQNAITRVNFSTYGASLVHLGQAESADGLAQPVAPLYNYLKEYPPGTLADFHARYGDREAFATQTAAPVSGMLNSGLQLYWLKHDRPDVYRRIARSLHLPQYCSYLFSGHAHDEATSLGCHTAMWDFGRMDYHRWLVDQGVDGLIPPIADTRARYPMANGDRPRGLQRAADVGAIEVGAGVHDSSAALVPYLMAHADPFLFVSTGTWVVTMNPFSADRLTADELRRGGLCYLTPDRRPVKSARLFLGHEFEAQSARIEAHFGVGAEFCASLEFDEDHLRAARASGVAFRPTTDLASGANAARGESASASWPPGLFQSAEVACHALNDALVALQLEAIAVAQGSTRVRTVFVDGGFSQNMIFLKLLARALDPVEVRITDLAQASATGAALLVSAPPDREALSDLLATTVVAP